MSQNIIDTGQAANDGTGEPLRQAFTAINNNFSQIWTSGPVNSNVQITDNRIATLQTNQALVLAPNGIGNVQANSTVVPGVNSVYDLGSSDRRWDTVWTQYIDVAGPTTFNDLTVNGNLTVQGNIIEIGNIVTDSKTIQLANTAANATAANGSGITVGANDNIATMLYNSSSNVWALNIGLSTGNLILVDDRIMDLYGPNITNADLISGATSGLDIVANGDANATVLFNTYGNIQLQTSSTGSNVKVFTFGYDGSVDAPGNISVVGNITGNYIFGNGSQLTGLAATYSNANVTALLTSYGSNVISTTGNITAGNVLGNIQAPNGNGAIVFNANGILGADAGFNYDAAANTMFVETGSFQGHPETGVQGFYVGVGSYTILGSPILAQLTSDIDSYSQVNLQNINSGNLASGDYIITADNGTDTTYYLDLGLASSNHADPGFFGDTSSVNDGYLYVAAANEAGPSTGGPGNLIVGSTNGVIKMFVGNTAQANVVATVESDKLLVAGNIIPAASNVFSLGNSTNQWNDLYVSNATIYMNNVPISLTAGNVLTVDGNDVVTTTANGQTSLGNLSVDDNNIYNTNGQGVVISNFSFIAEAETAYVQIPAGNSASDLSVVQKQGNVRLAANTADWTFDTTGNLTIPNGGYINFVNTGGITQAVNEDLRFTVSDNEEDGWAIQSTVNDGAGTDLTRMQVRYDGVRINTDLPTNNYSWDFRDTGEFDVPKSIRGPVGGNLVVSIGDQPSSNTFIDLQTRSYVGDALISNVRIANPNVTVSTSSGAHTWTFDGTGQMTLAGTPAIVKTIDDGYAFSGFISGISLTNPVVVDLTDNVFGGPESGKVTIFNVNGTTEANGTWYFLAVESNQFALYYDANQEQPVDGTAWTAWTSGGQALAYGQHDMTLIGGNIMLTADQNGVARDFSFGNTGNLTLPISGKIVGATANNNGYLNWSGNSSGDGGGYTTLRLVPDDTRESADQYLIIDPTAPGHIHIRAGGTQDNSSADLFLGGENSYFKVNAGANNEVRISANSYPWVFGADSILTVPGEGIIRSIQDTVILQSYDIYGNTYSARLGTNGGLYFETTDYPLGWLNLTNNAGNANISSPGGSINIDSANGTSGAAGKDINITAGDADQTDYYTTAGGDVSIQGGMGAFNDGGGGGPGGNVNLVAGTSADPAGHAGNVNITSGINNWVFDYSGNLTIPNNIITSGSAHIKTFNGLVDYQFTNSGLFVVSDGTSFGGAKVKAASGSNVALSSNDETNKVVVDNTNITVTANTSSWTFTSDGNLTAPAAISAAGNITGSYFIGDGSQLTGLPASYGDSNVAIFLAAYGSNTISTTGNITGNTAGYTIGYRDIPQVTFSANATAALTDAGKHYYSTTAGNLQITLPDNSSVAFPTGATLTIVVNAAGNVLVNQGTGVTLYQAGASATGNRVVGAYGLASVMKVAANTWVISGTGVY